jgi:chromosome segregation ATPase
VPARVPAKGKTKVEIVWAKRAQKNVAIDTDISTEVLKVYLAGGKAPPLVKEKLDKILELKRRMAEGDAEAARLRKQHDDTSRDQDRVRANLDMLRKTKGNRELEQQLAKKLGELESELGDLSGKLVRLSEERATLQREMVAIIRTVSLDSP